MKAMLTVAFMVIMPVASQAACSAWAWVGGRYICTQTQTASCVEWAWVGGRYICVRSQ